MFLRRLLRVVESFEGRPGRAGAWTESNVVFAAACLLRTFGAMRVEGEVSRLWAGWAVGWCCLVGAVAAVRVVEGAGVGFMLRLASTFDTARPHDTKAEAESAVRYLTAWLAREAYALPPAARSAALRVVAAFDDLVLGGVEAAPCGWCGDSRSPGPAGGVEAAPPGRASQAGAPGPAGAALGWFRYVPVGAPAPKVEAPPVDPCAPRPAPLREAVSGGLVKLFGYWWRADGDDPAGPARFELVALERGDLKLWRLAFAEVLGNAGELGDPRALVEGRVAARGHRVLSVVEPEEVETVVPSQWWNAMARAEDEIIAAGASKG